MTATGLVGKVSRKYTLPLLLIKFLGNYSLSKIPSEQERIRKTPWIDFSKAIAAILVVGQRLISASRSSHGHGRQAINTLAEIAEKGKSESARVSASIAILDRAYGRPAQLTLTDPIRMKRVSEMSDEELLGILAGVAPEVDGKSYKEVLKEIAGGAYSEKPHLEERHGDRSGKQLCELLAEPPHRGTPRLAFQRLGQR